MPSFKLVYFDVRSIAEPIRFIFEYAGVPYEDKRISFFDEYEWPTLKPTLSMQMLPVLFEDDQELTQSATIARYLARKFDLIPEDPFEAAICDEVMDWLSETVYRWRPCVLEQDVDEKAKKRAAILEGIIPLTFKKYEKLVQATGGQHVVGSKTNWADLELAHYLELFELTLDPNILDPYPDLKAFKENVFQIPQIKEWIEKRPAFTIA